MTPSEFAKSIRAKHPGVYDDLNDQALTNAVLKKYPQYNDMVDSATNPESMEFERGPNYPTDAMTMGEPSIQMAMLPSAVEGAVGLAKSVPDLVSAGADAVSDGLGSAVSKIKGMLPNPTMKGLGYTGPNVATVPLQQLASSAYDYARTAQPELGDLIAQAGKKAAGTDLVPAGEGVDSDFAAINPASNNEVFNQPIVNGMANSTQQMADLTGEQWKQAGDAINNTLEGLNKTGTQVDPGPMLEKINSMIIRDKAGNVMSTGWQGETNDAIREAAESLSDFAQNQKISWTEANQIKSGLQDSANYKLKQFDQANEAYKQVASLIKDGIDEQASKVLAENGGNVKDFQNLRGAYSKLSSLRSTLVPQAGKEMLGPQNLGQYVMSTVKNPLFQAGATGAAVGTGIYKGLTGGF